MTNFEYTDWFDHDGLGIPVLSETLVLVKFENEPADKTEETPEQFEEDMKLGLHDTYVAKYWGPHWYSSDTNPIIAYRVITPLT